MISFIRFASSVIAVSFPEPMLNVSPSALSFSADAMKAWTTFPTQLKSLVSFPVPVIVSGLPFIAASRKFGITFLYLPASSPGPNELKSLSMTVLKP